MELLQLLTQFIMKRDKMFYFAHFFLNQIVNHKIHFIT